MNALIICIWGMFMFILWNKYNFSKFLTRVYDKYFLLQHICYNFSDANDWSEFYPCKKMFLREKEYFCAMIHLKTICRSIL